MASNFESALYDGEEVTGFDGEEELDEVLSGGGGDYESGGEPDFEDFGAFGDGEAGDDFESMGDFENMGDFESGDDFEEGDSYLFEVGEFGEELDDPELMESGYGESGGEGDWESGGWDSQEGFDSESLEIERAEEFFGKLLRKAGRFIKGGVRALAKAGGPLLKRLAPIAAKVLGGAIGGPAGAAIAGSIASAVLQETGNESGMEIEAELTDEHEAFEEASGNWDAYADMEEAAAEAAEAASDEESLPALMRMATSAARMFAGNRRLRRVIPVVVKGVSALAIMLRKNPQTRWAIRVLPQITRCTLTGLSRQPRITRKSVVQALIRCTARALSSRGHAGARLRRHRRVVRVSRGGGGGGGVGGGRGGRSASGASARARGGRPRRRRPQPRS